MGDAAETEDFHACLQDICGLSENEVTSIIHQGYVTACHFRWIYKYIISELFMAMAALETT